MGTFRLDLIWFSWRSLMAGFGVTVGVSLVSMVVAVVLGLVVVSMRVSRFRFLSWPAFAYIQVFRGTSLYVFILWVYFGLAIALRINLIPIAAAVVCLGMLHGAYMAEIYRAGLGAVPRGQFEAARALGLSSWHVYSNVIAPQALTVIIPSAMNLFVDVLKDSALVGVVGVNDLMRTTDVLSSYYVRPFEFYTASSVLYVVSILAFSLFIVRRVEARFRAR